ncbi:MAG: MBL fold metallo-hydrolase [Acidobacteria bacterium]|nr:MBL fold metallo-hydrolase [Acidobacteriota bacterium]
MQISFHGAASEVTGSCHLVETSAGRVLLDCGMIQGGKERHERNREPFGFDATTLDAVVLSHAHIDHCGRLPVLRKAGYKGPIYATPATIELVRILLSDSGHIQEEDARWTIKRLRKKGKDASHVKPLYTRAEALQVLDQFVAVDFDRWRALDGLGRLRFIMAGHILGAAIVELELEDGDECRHVTFSGDLGVEGARLLARPDRVECPEVLLIESTYGDRERDDTEDRTELLYEIVRDTVERGGKVVIPSFAVGRTQEMLARLNDLVESGRLSGVPVFVDSPMAVEATEVFTKFPDAYAKEARRLYCSGDAPMEFPGLRLVTRVEDSKAINASRVPSVIISASGMCTAGRIKHHLKHEIGNPRSTVLFVGYQARGSLGRVIQNGTSPVRIHGDTFDVRARIEQIPGFSAHADRSALLDWYDGLGGNPQHTFVVHGDPDAAGALAKTLEERGTNAVVPELGSSFEL